MSSTLRVSVNALRRISERDRDDSTTPKAVQCKICIEKSSSPLAVITFRPTPIEYDRRGEFYWEPANGDCKNTVDLKVQDNDRFLTFSITHLHGRKSATRVLRLPLSDLAPTEEFSFDYPSNDMCWYPLQPNTSRRFTTALGRILKRQQYAAEGPQPEEVCLKIGWLRLSDTNRATHTQLHTSRSKEVISTRFFDCKISYKI
jgi:hypothetical protein